MPQQKSADKAFSTRFLPSDGIPEYNALLDEHLGKRREYLLGNKKSLELLQQTGVIARVERQHDNSNQYVVHVGATKAPGNESSRHLRRKRPPSLPDTGSASSGASRDHEAMWRALPPYGSKSSFMLRNSATTPDLGVSERMQEMRIREDDDTKYQVNGDNDERADHWQDRDELMRELEEEKESMHPQLPCVNDHDSATFDRASVSSISNQTIAHDRQQLPSSTTTAQVAALKKLGRSHSTMTVVRKQSVAPGVRQKRSDFGASTLPVVAEQSSGATRHRSRSVIEITPPPLVSHTEPSLLTRHSIKTSDLKSKATPPTSSSGSKTAVEHLLESDAAFVTQIRIMKEQLAELTTEKARLNDEIANVRRKLRGVNAVHENDMAVAHCAAVMQQRLAKAEEEYMKLVTAQQQVKTAVDRVRRELLSLKAVRRKLETDIDDVQRSNAAIEDKIHATKTVRNALSEELASLERQADQEREERKLTLPPEEAVIVDVERLMNVAASIRPSTSPSKSYPSVLLDDPPAVSTSRSNHDASSGPRLGSMSDAQYRIQHVDYIAAFDNVRETLRCSTGPSEFAAAFCETEEQLLAMYRASLAMKDELATLEKEQAAISSERATRHAHIRGSMQVSATAELALQHKVHAIEARIASYNDMREARNQEHAQLRVVMLRCLEILQAESMLASILPTLQTKRSLPSTPSSSSLLLPMGSSGSMMISGPGGVSSGTRPMVMSELPSSVMLEALQKKMTEVAMVLKVKHSAHVNETPEECFHTNSGRNGRRSNMFSTREVAKIVLGPRDPPGSTLAAIMESVQPPSIEAAMTMTEMGDVSERGGSGSIAYPIGEILIADSKHGEGRKSSSSPDRSTRQRKTFTAH